MSRRVCAALAAALALAGVAWAQADPAGALLDFDAAEVRRIVSHGPWPERWAPDPSNRASGRSAAIDLGRRLFFDVRLSRGAAVSCASCHLPERRFADGRPRGIGLAPVDRNTPPLANVRLQRWFGWDGAGDSLWAQSLRPILDAREMGMSAPEVGALVRSDGDLRCRYRQAFGGDPGSDDERVLVDVAKALAAFQETLATDRTAFDEFRDALLRGDRAAAARYPASAQRGARLFVGKGACSVCHVGPRFTNGEFHDIGVSFFAGPGRVDPGRYEGIRRLRASPFNLLGDYNDDPSRATAVGTRHVALEHRNWGEFKVPSLRDAALTAPYMHSGALATLRDVVRHYSELDPSRVHTHGERVLRPLRLSEAEVDDLVAFLETLADPSPPAVSAPAAGAACP